MKPLIATYRLQLTRDFDLHQAAALVDYLGRLRISHLYLSPIFESSPGSTHGYDVLDFSRLSEERGGPQGFEALCQAIRDKNSSLRLILDIVPNHMAATLLNPYWHDILERGTGSAHWPLFDLRPDERGKIHIPVLGKDCAEAIGAGEIYLETEKDPVLRYADHAFPLNREAKDALARGLVDIAALLDLQHYSLVKWTESTNLMTYRRFFDVTGLIGVRVEDEENYKKTHKALQDILETQPLVDGLRVDHIDGLADPAGYLRRLHQDAKAIWIEKILGPGEILPTDWPVRGTTGYEFISRLNTLFIDNNGERRILDWWKNITHSPWPDFKSCVVESKADVLGMLFQPELNRLISLSSDFCSAPEAKAFWEGMTLTLPVYRTYINGEPSAQDLRYIKEAAVLAEQMAGEIFSRAAKKLLPLLLHPASQKHRQIITEWQQLTGPVMAKGLEDTAHYRFTPFSALNEVGCSADLSPATPEDFFGWLNQTGRQYPHNFKATSTHDSKRSEDVRHRLYALSCIPEEWIDFCNSAIRINRHHKDPIDPATEIFLYQAIAGSWPMDGHPDTEYPDRIKSYALKSIREAKLKTSWLRPDEDYERAVDSFISGVLQDPAFLKLADNFVRKLSWMGALNSLAVLTVKILSPGIPDFYQGTEIWNLSLVDPDNRRPVDFQTGQKIINDIGGGDVTPAFLHNLLSNWRGGGIKLWLTQTLLKIRGDYLTGDISVTPVAVDGDFKDRVLAYRLSSNEEFLVVCAKATDVGDAEYLLPSLAGWKDTRLSPDAKWRGVDMISQAMRDSGEPLIAHILGQFPVAIIRLNAKQ